jgi:hypothetical protein
LNTGIESDKSFSDYGIQEARVFSRDKPVYYGSKEWANSVLRIGIADCRDLDRDRGSCSQEIMYCMKILSEAGYVWQVGILRYHYHLRLRNLRVLQRAKRADPINEGMGGLS